MRDQLDDVAVRVGEVRRVGVPVREREAAAPVLAGQEVDALAQPCERVGVRGRGNPDREVLRRRLARHEHDSRVADAHRQRAVLVGGLHPERGVERPLRLQPRRRQSDLAQMHGGSLGPPI
ncbi:MAG TPA: hypothetical protein VFX13_04570 [Gaiellales bacterium]|nr:hypothetical protein [Gaiellales bacterium]